jgi:uncharacterized membrane protein YjjB (DUF3815 family)
MIKLLMALLATISFAVIYQVPKKALMPAGLVGTGAWLCRNGFEALGVGPITGAFLGALFVAVASEVLARVQKLPGTVFIVSGIITLVPGISALNTMRSFMEGDYLGGISCCGCFGPYGQEEVSCYTE